MTAYSIFPCHVEPGPRCTVTERERWWSPDEVHPAPHPANRNNEFPSPFSHCMHHDIQLAIKHGLVIQWLMSPVAAVKGLGLSPRLGDWLRLPVYIPIMVTPLSPPFLSLAHTHTHSLSLSLSLSLLTILHYREDGEDHLQFSNLYDSALFNQRPLFPLQSYRHTHIRPRKETHTHTLPHTCTHIEEGCRGPWNTQAGWAGVSDVPDLQYPAVVSFVVVEGF